MRKTKYRKWPFILGTLCLLAAAALFLSNNLEDQAAGKQAKSLIDEIHYVTPTTEALEDTLNKGVEQTIPDYILNPDMEMPTIEIDGNLYIGTLFFPALDLELPVMSSWSYPGLKIAPCLYSGSIYKKDAVIAAHNYVSHFGRLSELSQGEVAYFTDVDGNLFHYEIIIQEVLLPTAIEEMKESNADLTLFTCTIGGASRFTTRLRLIDAP